MRCAKFRQAVERRYNKAIKGKKGQKRRKSSDATRWQSAAAFVRFAGDHYATDSRRERTA